MKKLISLFALLITSSYLYAYDFESDGIGYTIVSVQDRTVCVSKIISSGDIVIPDKVLYNDYWFSVDSISKLFDSTKSSSIKFNSLVKTDGSKLYGCQTAYFYVDESNPYMKAVDGVLYNKDMTRLISFPSYKNCEDFIIPESVTTIDDYSFGANKYITRLIFNNKIENLPENFIYGTDYSGRIKYLKLSDKIKVIKGRCLYNITTLKEIILPKELEEVEKDKDWGYYGLPTELTDITIFNSNIANYVYRLSPELYVFSRFNKLKNFYVKDKNPKEISDDIFTEGQYFTINLYVPKGTKDIYKNLNGWKNFYNIIEEDTNPDEEQKICSTPFIYYKSGKLTFSSATEGVVFVSNIANIDIKTYYDEEISLSATYEISVYATKEGYKNSETATATLCWIDQQPKTEGITNGIANIPAQAVLIQSEGGSIKVQGVDEGTQVNVYGINGTQAGSAISQSGAATINTNLQPGSIAIVKIGQKSVKVVVK